MSDDVDRTASGDVNRINFLGRDIAVLSGDRLKLYLVRAAGGKDGEEGLYLSEEAAMRAYTADGEDPEPAPFDAGLYELTIKRLK